MKRLAHSLRSQSIGVLALFVALGGTGYAAISIPKNSVGSRQIRNGAVTAKKLDGRSIVGYVAFWARVDSAGQVLASSQPATTTEWSTGVGNISFHGSLPRNCFPLANVSSPVGSGDYVSNVGSGPTGSSTGVIVEMRDQAGALAPQGVQVAEICP